MNKIVDMKKIGITLNIINSLFSNGINQNGVFLARLLKKCGYDVDIICGNESTLDKTSLFEDDINLITLKNSYDNKYDLLIQLGFTIEKRFFEKWKEKNPELKMVAYECGNKLIVNMERILFNGEDTSKNFQDRENDQIPDQVWYVPQQENTNHNFFQYYSKQENVTVVPFVWEPFLVEKLFSVSEKNVYEPKEIRNCGVMEPNMSVMKNSFYPTIILEKNQKTNPLDHIYLFGTDKVKDKKPFIDFILSTELYKDKRLSVESRYKVSKVLTEHADFVLSWQWENNLNYLWLEIAWMGYPIVHNGSLCKDVGYYYDGFDADMAVKKIGEVISKHNENHKIYLDKNREIIKRYTSENDVLVKQYTELINNVLENRFERKSYNWKENKIY